jgi:alpha-glucosidase
MEHDTAEHRWWHGAVLYQLYVRSWLDTNADGYGDLRGIIDRLDHLEWLGVDGIWLSPTMPSPDTDWGYDVSDYTGVHTELGALADLDELIALAGAKGMRVLLDLVPNHTSSAHSWFVDAASGRDSAYRDYYVWADAAPGGGPPNNWLDSTGRSAWEWDAGTSQYYLHNFLASQPDLNWWQPAVHEEFRQILDFWFDRGVAGFRIDVAHGLYKDAQLRDNPVLENGGPLEARYGLRPVYSANQPEVHGVYRDWRKMAERHSPPRLLLGETWVADPSELARFYGDNDELQLAFNFPFVFAKFTAAELADVVRRTLDGAPAGACPVWMASNHDVGRFPSRWCGDDDRKARLALLVLATLPGTAVLYYGDEIGMLDVDVPPELQRDEMTLDGLGDQGNRDRARTPMQWDASPGGGFTTAPRPWLPAGDTAARNVEVQRDDPASTLVLCRDLLALRRAELGGQISSYEQLPSADGLWAYRVGELIVLANLSDQAHVWPGECGEILMTADGDALDRGPDGIPVAPWQGLIGRRLPVGLTSADASQSAR